MKSKFTVFPMLALLAALVLGACGGGAPAPNVMEVAPSVQEEFAAPQEAPADIAVEQPVADTEAGSKSSIDEGSVYETGTDGTASLTTHLIIKSAEMRLLVEDSDIAIDRLTQIVGDTGGYIISSQVYNQVHLDGKNYRYATITIGVPVQQFERALSRLRNISIQVLNENASGEDVTDQYVDLQSELANLEATRDRIKSFLEDAKTVDEALRINAELSAIEGQIEEIKGRINYLQDRSAYSTITVTIDPKLPEIIPTPTPTPEPNVWKPGDTFEDARKSVTMAYQHIVDFLIWFFVVLVPIFAPPILILWLVVKFFRRKTNKSQ